MKFFENLFMALAWLEVFIKVSVKIVLLIILGIVLVASLITIPFSEVIIANIIIAIIALGLGILVAVKMPKHPELR